MIESCAREILSDDLPPANTISFEDARRPLKHRHELLAHMAAVGVSAQQIAQDLGLTPSYVSVILGRPGMQARIEAIRDAHLHFNDDMDTKMARLAAKVPKIFEEALDSNSKVTNRQRLKCAKWIFEWQHGKARVQEEAPRVDHMALVRELRRMKEDEEREIVRKKEERDAVVQARRAELIAERDRLIKLIAEAREEQGLENP